MATGTSCEVERQIHTEIRALECVADRVVEVIARAEANLLPVLTPPLDGKNPGESTVKPPVSPIANDIHLYSGRIGSAVDRLVEVLERLEV